MKRKNRILLLVILYVFLVGFFSSTGTGMQELIIFAILTAMVIASSFIVWHYYLTDKNSLKQRLIYICISFIKLTVFTVAVKELTGVTLEYSALVVFFIAYTIFTLWQFLDLSVWEKGVLVLVLVTVLGVKAYERAEPSTAYQLYRSELSEVTHYEEMQDLLQEDYWIDFTTEDFQGLKPYLALFQEQQFLRFFQPAFLEFEDGQMVMLEVSRKDPDNKLRFSNIKLLPEEIGSYFRYYPLEIERKADYPKGKKDSKAIIETRGAFISHASLYQEREWYEKLIGVFGDEKVWGELLVEMDSLQAPEGPICGWGTSSEGYLFFRFCQDWEVDKEVLDEIYIQFQDKAAKHDIFHLPVVFQRCSVCCTSARFPQARGLPC
ncbi:MAG: hypothetical protein PHT62_11965 [Desulfotomaculaceae bacterium]|nr:hypothetical protein [Desulfotomaculaceae bacterium]